MNKNSTIIFLLLGITTLLLGCRATTLQNIERSEFPARVSSAQVKQAIIRASKKKGWKIKSSDNNTVIASYSYKKNKFGAVVSIDFDSSAYSISYLSSHNLKYQVYAESPNESESMFSEYNPFKKSVQSTGNQIPATIHKRYNQWVTALDQQINSELSGINKHQYTARTKQAKSRTRTLAKSTAVNCNDEPSSIESGLAKITKSSVNIRSGANTTCSLIGTVSGRDTFSLLGRKNNWYYISLNQNQKAWIYAPFVKKVDGYLQDIAKPIATPPPIPEEPAVPTRNISIAVIQFKTLNKEAQKISLGELVSETFTSALVNSQGFRIIEREQLDKVVKEMEMNQTGFIETTDAVEIGKMLHADAIITGSVALLNKQIQLNARIIEIESAYVISADTKTTTYTLQNITRIVNEIVVKLSRKLLKNTKIK